ncbi:flavocytochrome c [Sedimentibacter sp. B4]|uniref:flavocytochrome c n=1 Tax=Sedimentibacter sp. B4 TaxID=304766 RepID=UPI0002E0D443|nr:flavocytochrome c [Sedimentibacter sp. B4]
MKTKNKILSVILATFMMFNLVACGQNGTSETAGSKSDAVETAGLKNGTYTASQQGHNGPVNLEVSVNEGKISNITVISHSETPGLGDSAMEKLSALMLENNSVNADVIAGATFSSNAIINGVKEALTKAGASEEFLNSGEKISAVTKLDKSEYSYDVIVIGAGGAGLSAAVEAAQNGASVVVLEKTSQTGGNTLVSGGGINIPGSDVQIANGIEDSVEKFIEDTLKGGDNINDKELVGVVANNALDAYNWLVNDIHVEFMQDRIQQFGGHSVPRAVIPVGNKGTEMIKKLETKSKELGVDLYTNTTATQLIVDENSAVVGVYAENDGNKIKFNSNKGVIIATGGFGANIEMRVKYNPAYNEDYKTTCVPASTGDGIIMAEDIGAQLVDMEYIQVYPTCNTQTGIISYVANSRFDGAILINGDGKRFIDEMGRRDIISNAITSQEEKFAYLVWGQEIETVGNMTKVHEKEYKEFVNSDLLHKAETLEELAEFFNIDKDSFVNSINEYNNDIADGSDDALKRGGTLRTISQGPFYIQKVAPSTHHTMGGIKINVQGQVISTEGNIIPNLYAAGEVTGGIHGTNRLGGNAITDIVVMGRIAAQNLTK